MKYIIIDTKINANKLEIYFLEGHTALMGIQLFYGLPSAKI